MNRRGFLGGLLAVPAIIRTPGLLMAVSPPFLIQAFSWGPEYPLALTGLCGKVRYARHRSVDYVHGIPFGSQILADREPGYHPMVYSSVVTPGARTIVMRASVFQRQLSEIKAYNATL